MRAVCDIRPQKTDNLRTRLTSVVNLIDYQGEVSKPTSKLTTMKLHVNSTISDVKSRYMCMDLKDFYTKNQMDRAEYIMLYISMIKQECLEKYNLKEKAHNGYIFAQVTKGKYDPPQAHQIAHDTLVKHLEPYGYRP